MTSPSPLPVAHLHLQQQQHGIPAATCPLPSPCPPLACWYWFMLISLKCVACKVAKRSFSLVRAHCQPPNRPCFHFTPPLLPPGTAYWPIIHCANVNQHWQRGRNTLKCFLLPRLMRSFNGFNSIKHRSTEKVSLRGMGQGKGEREGWIPAQVVAPVAVTCWKCFTAFPAGKLSASYYKKRWQQQAKIEKKEYWVLLYKLYDTQSVFPYSTKFNWVVASQLALYVTSLLALPSHYAFMIIIEIHENLRTTNKFFGVWLISTRSLADSLVLLFPLPLPRSNIISAELANPQYLRKRERNALAALPLFVSCNKLQLCALQPKSIVDWHTELSFRWPIDK